jgi:predicted ribosome quality control (RQC) complex YloA/Tae2 family protein
MNEPSPYEQYLADINRKINKAKKLIKNLNSDKDRFKKTLLLENDAKLLLAHMHNYKKGMKEIRIIDYSTDQFLEKVIALDPQITLKVFLDKMFNNIKKAKRGLLNVQTRITESKKDLVELESHLAEIILKGEQEFKIIKTSSKKELIKEGVRKPYRVYTSSDDIKILVGRSAKDSDELTLRHSRGNEWWFHARDTPGAHVLVKYSKDILPESTLREAAMLAAYFSKNKNSGPVSFTRVKFIKKPKNAKAGTVSLSREKVIDIVITEDVLQKILKTSGL